MAPVFSLNHEVTLIRNPGTPQESRELVMAGGTLEDTALFHLPVKPCRGDLVEANFFDEPRVITKVTTKMTMEGPSYYEAALMPLSLYQCQVTSPAGSSMQQHFYAPVGNVSIAQGSGITQVFQPAELPRIEKIVDRLIAMVQASADLDAGAKQECQIDAEQLKLELRRPKRISERIWELVDRLSKLGGATKLVEMARPLLEELRQLLSQVGLNIP